MKGLKNSIGEAATGSNIIKDIIDTNIELLQEMDIVELEKSLDQAVEWIKSSRKLYVLG